VIIRGNSVHKHSVGYTEKEIKLAVNMIKDIENTIDMMYYLMERNSENNFVLMLISANNVDLKALLKKEKRDTDIVYNVGEDECVCAMLCQETKVDGGYRFAERLINNIILDKGEDIYCAEIEVRMSKYSAKDIIFRVVDAFIKARQEKKSGEIIFHSLY
jgi:hypothetical protein